MLSAAGDREALTVCLGFGYCLGIIMRLQHLKDISVALEWQRDTLVLYIYLYQMVAARGPVGNEGSQPTRLEHLRYYRQLHIPGDSTGTQEPSGAY